MNLSLVTGKNIPRRGFKDVQVYAALPRKQKERRNRKSKDRISCPEYDIDLNVQQLKYAYNEQKFVPSHQAMVPLSSVSYWSRSRM